MKTHILLYENKEVRKMANKKMQNVVVLANDAVIPYDAYLRLVCESVHSLLKTEDDKTE